MTDYAAILEGLSEAHQRVYEALYRAAYLGEVCPSNVDLARIGGISTYARWGTDAVAILEREELIRVERGRTTRVVVLASGQATASKITEGRAVTFNNARTVETPIVRPEPRTPCTYCGVRSDIGCVHSRRAA